MITAQMRAGQRRAEKIMLKRHSMGKNSCLNLKESRITSLNRDFAKASGLHSSQLQNGNSKKNYKSIGRQELGHMMPFLFVTLCFYCWHVYILLCCEVFIHISLALPECLAHKHSTVFDKWLNDSRVNSLEVPIHFRSMTL